MGRGSFPDIWILFITCFTSFGVQFFKWTNSCSRMGLKPSNKLVTWVKSRSENRQIYLYMFLSVLSFCFETLLWPTSLSWEFRIPLHQSSPKPEQSEGRKTEVQTSKGVFERVKSFNICIYFLMALQPLWALTAFQSHNLFTIGRAPWTSDQLVARSLPKYRTAQTE
jgi:hypothetical protein